MAGKASTKSLLELWKESKQKQSLSHRIAKAPEGAKIPASSGQKRLWFLHQLYPENPVYNYSEWYHFKGKIDADILKQSVQQVYRSNSILRTYFAYEDDILYQHIDPEKEIPIREYDLSTLPAEEKTAQKDALLMADAGRYFDLDHPPLLRVILLKLDQAEWILMVTMHHIITDKWSMKVYREQLAKAYRELTKNPNYHAEAPEIEFLDYAYWEQGRETDTGQLDYWKEKLSGEIPELKLPVDHLPVQGNTFKGDRCIRQLGSRLSAKLVDLAAQMETTPYVLMLAAYYLMLYRYSGQKDILLGTPVSNRQEKVLEELIGFFDETLVLRTQIDPDISFLDWVHQVKTTVLEAFSNKDISFDVLVNELKVERAMGVNPFFRSMFIYHAVPPTPVFDPEVELDYSYLNNGVTKFDLTLFIGNDQGELMASFEYSTELFEETTIERFHEHYKILLEGIAEDPNRLLRSYAMRTEEEIALFTAKTRSETHAYSKYQGIHKVIEEAAKAQPTANALVFQEGSLTFSELNAQADRIAAHILTESKGENTIVGLAIDRSLEMISGMLGILKAGCAYLPLDTEYPVERLEYMIADAGASLILVADQSETLFRASELKILNVNKLGKDEDNITIPLPEVSPEDLAYIIYTSGSTGQPKGVPISHANILSSTAGRLSYYPEQPSAFLLMSSISFDSSKAGIFWTLCTGGTLVIATKRIEQEPGKLLRLVREQRVSHSLMLPSLYQVLLEFGTAADFKPLKTMIIAGEACPTTLIDKHLSVHPEVSLYNEYGPTEGTVWCTAHRITAEDAQNSVPIGKPVAGMQVWILDDELHPVPYGVSGQLFISGPGLSKGYLNRSELSEKSFVRTTLGNKDIRLYATGDRVRFRKDGNLEFKGRIDQQIKIRGYRVELEAIDHALMEALTCTEAKVVWDEKQKILRGAFVSEQAEEIAKVKEGLGKRLPSYMIPAQLLQLDALPLLPNGKVDTGKLQETLREIGQEIKGKIEAPENETQELLQAIWQTVLQRSPIGIHDNFFEIGGDSISSIQIIAKARGEGLAIEPNQLFEYQTIAELSQFVKPAETIIKVEEDWGRLLPLTPIQHWFFDTFRSAPHNWNQIVTLETDQVLSFDRFKAAIEALVNYHEGLRMAFEQVDGTYMARILPEAEVSCCQYMENVQEKDISDLLRSEQESCKLDHGNLFRMIYMHPAAGGPAKIFLIAHHLVIDMVSWNSIFDDLKTALDSLDRQEQIHFKPKTDSLIQYTHFIQDLSENLSQGDLNYWKAQFATQLRLPFDSKTISKPFREENSSISMLEMNEPDIKEKINQAHSAFNTNTEDLLLAALYYTLHSYATEDRVSIYLERHGRAIEHTGVDFTNTMGWFTSFFPHCLAPTRSEDMSTVVRDIKEQLRQIPQDGIGFGVLNYVQQHSGLKSLEGQLPEVVFNYLGQESGGQKDQKYRFDFLGHSHRDPKSERQYALEINAFTTQTGLRIRFTYDTFAFKESTIKTLIDDFKAYFNTIILHCLESETIGFTPSDFPEAEISQDDLDNLLELLG